jgi:hypothetical protein
MYFMSTGSQLAYETERDQAVAMRAMICQHGGGWRHEDAQGHAFIIAKQH